MLIKMLYTIFLIELSLVPAAAVIQALIAYIKVAGVKRLVVGFQGLCILSKYVSY